MIKDIVAVKSCIILGSSLCPQSVFSSRAIFWCPLPMSHAPCSLTVPSALPSNTSFCRFLSFSEQRGGAEIQGSCRGFEFWDLHRWPATHPGVMGTWL